MPGELAAPYRPPCYYNGTWPDSSRRNILLGGCQQHWRESEQDITRWRNNMPETPAEQTTAGCSSASGTLIDKNCYKKITAGATAEATLTDGKVTSIALTNEPNADNKDYTFVPAVTISGGGGTGATAHAILGGTLITVDVDTGGFGYTVAPTVEFVPAEGDEGTGAAAIAVLEEDAVGSVIVTKIGTGYAATPTVNLVGGDGEGATAHATLTPVSQDSVSFIEVDTQGSGYTSTPTVSVGIPKWNLATCDKSRRWKAVSAHEWQYGSPGLHSPSYGGGPYQLKAIVADVDGVTMLSWDATFRDCSNSAYVEEALYRKSVATVIKSYEATGRYAVPWGEGTLVRSMQINDAGVLSTPENGDSESTDGDSGTAASMITTAKVMLFESAGACVDKCYLMTEQQMWGVFAFNLCGATVSNLYSGYSMTSGPTNDQVFNRGDTIEFVGEAGDATSGGRIEVTYHVGYHLDWTHETWSYSEGVQVAGRTETGHCVCGDTTASYSLVISDFSSVGTTDSSVSVVYVLSNAVTLDADLKTLLAQWDMSNDIVYPWVETGYGDHPHVYRDAYQSSRQVWPMAYNSPPDVWPNEMTSYFDFQVYSEDGVAWSWNSETQQWDGGPFPDGNIRGAPAIPASGELVDRHYWFKAPNGTSTPGAWNTSITGLPRTATRWLAFDPLNCTGYQFCAAGAHSEHQQSGLRYMQKMVWSIPTLPSLNYFGPCGEMRTWYLPSGDECSETLRFPDAWAICGRLEIDGIDAETKTVTLKAPATYLVSGDTIDFTTYDASFAETVTAEEYTVDTVSVDKLSFTYTDEITPEGDYIKDHGAPHYKWNDTNPKGDFIWCKTTYTGRGAGSLEDRTSTECEGGSTACLRNTPCAPMIVGYSPNTDTEHWPANAKIKAIISAPADTLCGAYWRGLAYGGMSDPFHPQDPDTCEAIAQSVEARCLPPTGATVPADKSDPPVPYITLGCNGPVQLSPALNPPEGAWV